LATSACLGCGQSAFRREIGRNRAIRIRPGPGRARVRDEVLHPGGQLGSGREQYPGVLHPGRDQVPGHRSCGQAGAGSGVPAGLGLAELPDPLPPAREPACDLAPSPALSILANGPRSFAGRKLGILVTDGADADKLAELTTAADQAKVTVELIAPAVGGVETSDGKQVPAGQNIDGGPSVLYDAVVVLAPRQSVPMLAALPAARDFVADAFAHCKFIGYAGDATPLFEAAGLASLIDDGFADLGRLSAADFLSRCARLRFWPRQASIAEKAAAAQG
jgi:C-terminal domain found in long catalases